MTEAKQMVERLERIRKTIKAGEFIQIPSGSLKAQIMDGIKKAEKLIEDQEERIDITTEGNNKLVARWLDSNGNYVPLDDDGLATGEAYCSICGDWLSASDEYPCRGKYCPNCGAKMNVSERMTIFEAAARAAIKNASAAVVAAMNKTGCDTVQAPPEGAACEAQNEK